MITSFGFFALRQCGNRHAFRQRDIRELEDLVEAEFRDVEVQVLGQVPGQADHFDFGHVVLHLAAALLHADRNVLAEEVDRDQHLDLFVFDDALEVHVHDLRLRRVTLHVLEDRSLALFPNLDVEDARVERLVVELLDNAVMVKRQCAGRAPGAVDDCGYHSLVTQAAARTFPLVLTDLRNQIEIVTHDYAPYLIEIVEVFSTEFPAEAATSRRRGAHGNRSPRGTPAMD
jgi:hypothetical protein